MTAPDLLLHHYPRSPFAEKIRVALGLKGLRWRSVEQPRMAPKPQLVPLTGGYRRIPVLQIGADIYCDTRCILAELERRWPAPTLYPADTRGRADMIAGWADQALFATSLGLVFGTNGDRFPPELHADRATFTAGKFDGWNSAAMRERLPSLRDAFRTQLDWIGLSLKAHPFLLGDAPSLADIAVYHPLWYALGNLGDDAGLTGYPQIMSWMDRMAAFGHGTVEPMTPADALAIARQASPLAPSQNRSGDWEHGAKVAITPTDWGFDSVIGKVVADNADSITLHRHDLDIGDIHVHFPRIGFEIVPR